MRNIPLEKLEFIALILKAISHPIRLKIIESLEERDQLNVQEISNYLNNGIEQSLLSHHLIKMRDKGILECSREGQFVYYKLKFKEMTNLLNCMENCNAY